MLQPTIYIPSRLTRILTVWGQGPVEETRPRGRGSWCRGASAGRRWTSSSPEARPAGLPGTAAAAPAE